MSSRRYVKRVWRVPANRGPVEYFAALVLKLLVKHGWPAKVDVDKYDPGFWIISHDHQGALPPDFAEAASIAVRIVARMYRVDVTESSGWVSLNRSYRIANGHFRENRGMNYHGQVPVKEAVLHCAAIKTGQFKGMRGIQVFSIINRWHMERGFKSFGYHGLVMPDGQFITGRPYGDKGAHVRGHNTGTLGFLLIESREVTRIGDYQDWFTEPQRVSLRSHLAGIRGLEKVSGHNDYAPKLCPGFRVNSGDWL